jgi:digeranylgeranylglycerophospholipid reductase
MIGCAMPLRATKRGAARTPLERDCDILVCGASFAGLAVARELAGARAKVMLIDRYEIGERQTSACAAPSEWLAALGLHESIRQTFGELVVHTPQRDFRYGLPWTFSTFDYRELCATLHGQTDAEFETAKVDAITRSHARVGGSGPLAGGPQHTVHTDRGDIRAPLVVDALGWRRMLSSGACVAPPHQGKTRAPGHSRSKARLSRGLEVHPPARGEDLEIWIDPRYVRAGYSWSFPADDEVRVGVGSFEPRDHVREPTVRLAGDLRLPAVDYQGNWIPHELRPAIDEGVFFVGDSAGHCLPLTAEGIRTALYFGLACGRELRAVVEGRMHRETALSRYAAFSEGHAWAYRWLLRSQHIVGRIGGRPLLTGILRGIDRPGLVRWMFDHYLAIAPPSFARAGRLAFTAPPARTAAAA